MRVLAIDTALAACAAAVLDTDHGIVASETLPRVRGHGESLPAVVAHDKARGLFFDRPGRREAAGALMIGHGLAISASSFCSWK